jgi:hypothetical protein
VVGVIYAITENNSKRTHPYYLLPNRYAYP